MSPKEKKHMSELTNTISNVMNSSPDEQLDKAFKDIEKQYTETGSYTLPMDSNTSKEDTFSNDKTNDSASDTTQNTGGNGEVTNDNNSQLGANQNTNNNGQPVGQQTPDTNVFNSDNSVSVEQLQAQLREKENEINLWASRASQIAAQYQELKARSTNSTESDTTKHEIPDNTHSESQSESVKEFFEIYPDIAEAVNQMIEERSKRTAQKFENVLNERVIPIQQHIQQSAAQQFTNKILAAHPDAAQLVQSKQLRNWVETLDPLMRAGAHTIMQYGNADEVISLISQYKMAQGNSSSSVSSSSFTPTTNGRSNSNNVQVREDEIARKVFAMLNTPSNSQEPSIVRQTEVPMYKSEEEAFEALARDYEKNLRERH